MSDDARAYPLQILTWHEIVNDTVGGLLLTITFCPLCNTAIAFERTLDGRVLDFGTTGRLLFSNLIMYDRQTESWWQQVGGDAIAGELAGLQLTFYPVTIISWDEFKAAHPDGQVLSRETGFNRSYGSNPYVGYDDVTGSPFLFRGPPTPGGGCDDCSAPEVATPAVGAMVCKAAMKYARKRGRSLSSLSSDSHATRER